MPEEAELFMGCSGEENFNRNIKNCSKHNFKFVFYEIEFFTFFLGNNEANFN